jgi:cbb3-type cytochrome oxidase cytochrome c subunit
MLKGIFGIFSFIFFLIVFILMLTGGYIVKKIKEFQKAANNAAQQKARNYRNETGRQRQQYAHNTQNSQRPRQSQESQEPRQPYQTKTATGETIIDHHHQERENRKIFDDSDGEYVEFTES